MSELAYDQIRTGNAAAGVEQGATTTRAVVVARVSSDEQAASGLGIAAQLHACHEWARRNGAAVAAEFVEDGVSGATGLESRPAMIDAIAALEPGDVLLCAKRDRLGRDPMVIAMIEAGVVRKRCRVVSAAGEGTDSDEPSAILMRRLVDSFAEYERLVIKARTRAALAAKRRRGERTGSVPFGHDLADDRRTLIPNETELALVGLMRQWKAAGLSYRQIADEMNRAGIPTKTGIPSGWRHSTIVSILNRRGVA